MNESNRRHPPHSSRKRFRSPREDARDQHVNRHRSRSPDRRHHHEHGHRHHHHHHQRPKHPSPHTVLPSHARPLHKRDVDTHRALFAEYLDLQKALDIDTLSADFVRGRWKSFVGKWNRGELAEGWYDPDTKRKVDLRFAGGEEGSARNTLPEEPHRRELLAEDREAQRAQIREDRRQDRKTQKERLEELVPRAEPGTRERQLEKKREKAAANRAFRDAKEGGGAAAGGMEEVDDKELMGGGGDGDGEDDYKAQIQARERQKNQREIRKEEVLRARAAEREGRVAEHRRKEERTMEMLRELAKQRFGS
ncbi:hypothetical protein D0859_15077 [Hortaea werneckii]|uniref:Uncharacterized protein n=1 Tax=Hortaea werneckii TaxID=91943 RepID=A0A3M7I5V9_HORWE|nr:hypothetical protein D0859_15077 [Hortaea werneckii]